MWGGAGVWSSRELSVRVGAAMAATAVAAAGLFGLAGGGSPIFPGAPSAAQQRLALTAYPTFTESLQSLLDAISLGDLDQVLAAFGDVPGTNTPLSVSTDVADVLAAFNPDGTTLAALADIFDISLTQPLYSANPAIPSLLGAGSLFVVDGVPIGNLELGEMIDVVLGEGAGEHSLTDLASAVGLGPLLGQYAGWINAFGLENLNYVNCGIGGIACGNPDLTVNSSLVDWLTAFVTVPTTDVTRHVAALFGPGTTTVLAGSGYTLGEYLHILPVSATNSTTMDNASLALLFGLNPAQTWDQFLAELPFGGTLLDPSGETWGEQSLGTFLASFLPEDSALAIAGDTAVTDFLVALGLLAA
ncbi:hypothetical protein H7H52_09790 [Mycolicibacter hiberniae]|uniref:Uncharacterized protein n=2 Tax=Mycolicibacter hiberniae TaxID=29314 RepID=A0A7I7X3E4_9MYCO|nr:hypothetical protein [Mycolicibacter hiberniae]MCV7086011.1 hypothetical protein [Mycolicibacter hiberniae]ORV72049.1 hypothetical protein AWC09_01080 [Mycolicibacter hiberniae]BBZ24124.1 hypothetical protein MHIB_25420 [Mycolicibacter hiberniae]